MKDKKFNFKTLIGSIQQVHAELAAQASRAVNLSLTLRNWLIGAYIAEYELNGANRAQYGDTLLERLADELKQRQVGTCGRRQLYQYLLFYRVYPEIVRSSGPGLFIRNPYNLESNLLRGKNEVNTSAGDCAFRQDLSG